MASVEDKSRSGCPGHVAECLTPLPTLLCTVPVLFLLLDSFYRCGSGGSRTACNLSEGSFRDSDPSLADCRACGLTAVSTASCRQGTGSRAGPLLTQRARS